MFLSLFFKYSRISRIILICKIIQRFNRFFFIFFSSNFGIGIGKDVKDRVMVFNATFNDISVISSGLSISYEVAGYFQKVGGEMEVLLCPDIFRPGVWGLQKQCVNL
jgi:hypothetical protein